MRNRSHHPWHDIEVKLDSKRREFNVVIEIPADSKNKYEMDLKTGFLKLDRVLYSAMHYPASYGFIPQTLGQDTDPLDILVLSQEPIHPLTIVRVRAIAGFRLTDDHGIDDKIVCVNITDPAFKNYKSSKDLPPHILAEIMDFFEAYKVLEKKSTEVGGMFSAQEAVKIIKEGYARYFNDMPWTDRWFDENKKDE